jgi:hypothetical protein
MNLRTPEDGDITFSETSLRNNAKRYKFPEDIFNIEEWCRVVVVRTDVSEELSASLIRVALDISSQRASIASYS